MSQITTLIQSNWIAVPRAKRGRSSHKAFLILNKEGSKILKERSSDFEVLFYSKDDDSFIFTAENKPNQSIRRETLTK